MSATITLTPEDIDRLQDEYAHWDIEDELLANPVLTNHFDKYEFSEESIRYDLLDIMSNPDNFHFTCKTLLNIRITPTQQVVLRELYTKPYQTMICTRGFSKSFSLAITIILKCVFEPGTKIAIIGVGLRQSKNLYEYVKRIWDTSPLLREMANRNDDGPAARQDRFIFKFGTSQASFLPLGTSGSSIRGERANIIIIDEYGDVPKSIIDTVVIGFGAVSKDPEQKQLLTARIKRAKKKGKSKKQVQALEELVDGANAILLAGTAKPYFNHFAQEWESRKKIILSRGDKTILKQLRSERGAEHTNPEHYSIIRIPYDLIPEGFMSDETIALAEASLNSLLYNQEYMACFPRDTNGFFPASLIYQQCTADQDIFYNNALVTEPFPPMLFGDPAKQYILGVDPARINDDAALVLLELNETHTRVVYCWSTNQKKYDNMIEKTGNADLGTYYQYIATHILDLMVRFNIIHIAMDSQGGGHEIANILAVDQAVLQGRTPLYPLNDDNPLWNGKKLETDDLNGRHIIELVTHSAQYTSDSHHGLLSDLEKMKLFFPQHDAVSLSLIEANFKAATGESLDFDNDPMTVCINEINELKYEMTIIEYTTVGDSGRERWDTPEVKKEGDKKGRLRNDRESALVMANYAARRLRDKLPDFQYNSVFTYVGAPRKLSHQSEEKWAAAPDWFIRGTKDVSVIRII